MTPREAHESAVEAATETAWSEIAFIPGIDPTRFQAKRVAVETMNAYLTALHEAGYRVVPVEATDAMIQEARKEALGSNRASLVWRAYLKSAPPFPED